jgi:hypothetical protein
MNDFAIVNEEVGHLHVKISPPVAMIAVPRFGLFRESVDEYECGFTAVFTWTQTAQ